MLGEVAVSSVIESLGVAVTRASIHARRAWRQMILDACVGLFLVLMLTIAGALLVYAAFAFAQTMMPDYAAALVVAAVIALVCVAVYVFYLRAGEVRSAAVPAVSASSVAGSAGLPPSAVSLALMTALAVARLCGRGRDTRTGC